MGSNPRSATTTHVTKVQVSKPLCTSVSSSVKWDNNSTYFRGSYQEDSVIKAWLILSEEELLTRVGLAGATLSRGISPTSRQPFFGAKSDWHSGKFWLF